MKPKQTLSHLQTAVLAVLSIYLKLTITECKNVAFDFYKTAGRRVKISFFKQAEDLLKSWQSLYMKQQEYVERLIWNYKHVHINFSESRDKYCDFITQIDKQGIPIHKQDREPQLVPFPEFSELPKTNFIPLKQRALSRVALSPEIHEIPGTSPKLIAKISGIANQLGQISTQDLREQLSFKKFAEKLPQITNQKIREIPVLQNVLAALSNGVGMLLILILIYLCALISEVIVFLNLGTTVLGLQFWKAIFFSLVLVGASYLLGLLFYNSIVKFARSVKYMPWIYWLFLACVLFYVTSAGYLNYEQYNNTKRQEKYTIANEDLNNLYTIQFTNPNDPNIKADIDQKEAEVSRLKAQLQTDKPTTNIIGRMLYICISLVSLLVSSMLLAFKIIVGRVYWLNRQQKRALKSITSFPSMYEHELNKLQKMQELMSLYCHFLGKKTALLSLQAAPPQVDELLPTASQSPIPDTPQNQKTTIQSESTKSTANQDILDTADYETLYQS
ncbi:hypothetical protein [Kordia sp.]|uniref:hypothetical protein n=1 Tax=Kordia sp. TaxID=1965332 RepID=UPI003D6AEE39